MRGLSQRPSRAVTVLRTEFSVFSEAARKSFSAVMQCRDSGEGPALRSAMIVSKWALRSCVADNWRRISPIVNGKPGVSEI